MKGNTVFYFILGGIVFLAAVFYAGRSYGKNKPPDPMRVPEDTPGTTESKYDPTALTDRLYRDIKGLSSIAFRDMDAWKTLISLSDTDFVKVINDWNQRYYSKYKESLYQAYENEWFNPYTTFEFDQALRRRFEKFDKSKIA
jgi:hypothetical protein